MMGKYEKIVALSTLAEAKSIVDISVTWFGNKGRLYQPAIRQEIEESIKKGNLIKIDDVKVKANTGKIIKEALSELNLGDGTKLTAEYRKLLTYFYINLAGFTQPVYLGFETIKSITKLDQHRADNLDIKLLLQLPFLFRYLEIVSKPTANIVIQILDLEEYESVIEKLEQQNLHILLKHGQRDNWVLLFERTARMLPKLQKKGLAVFTENIKALKAVGG